ncbi:hypothetical protein B296_00033988, partial [Ensete ventricosum]
MLSPPALARNILVTGGAGYIGSHTVLQLLKGGYRAVVVDNLDNSSEVGLERVRDLAGEFRNNLAFHRVPIPPPIIDLRDREALEKVFSTTKDYIHVVDLADGHIAALQKLFEGSHVGVGLFARIAGCEVYNLATGKGSSVLEIVAAFEKASGKVLMLCYELFFSPTKLFQRIPLIMAGRRPGDAEIVYASTAKAEEELHWKYAVAYL